MLHTLARTAQGKDPCFTGLMAILLCSSVTIIDNKEQMLSLLNSKWQLHLNHTEVETFLTYFWKRHIDIFLECSSHMRAGNSTYACMLPMPSSHPCCQAIHTICNTHHYTQTLLMHISVLARWACNKQCSQHGQYIEHCEDKKV